MGEDTNREQNEPEARRAEYGLSLDCVESFEPEPSTGFRRACGVALSVIGVLTLALSGVCAVAFLSSPHPVMPMYAPLLVAGPFVFFGLLLWWAGDTLRWRPRRRRPR